MVQRALVMLAGLWMAGGLSAATAADPFYGADPLWSLLHEPPVLRELRIAGDQAQSLELLLDTYDGKFFPLRNHPSDRVGQEVETLLTGLVDELKKVLTERQLSRLMELRRRCQGSAALLSADGRALLDYTEDQRAKLQQAADAANETAAALQKRLAAGEPRGLLEKAYATAKEKERLAMQAALTQRQITAWQRALGRDFDLSALGQPTYKAPELIDSGEWINTAPLSLKELAGKVVVVHFYACGCINCIHNYPVYLDWSTKFAARDVVILGIHTPETSAEEELAHVRQRAEEAGFTFPVLIDVKKTNWNAWGNSMWPSVYLVDKQGRLRYFWPGELKWQGATGDQWMTERIIELLAE